jgi:hypothetical protein
MGSKLVALWSALIFAATLSTAVKAQTSSVKFHVAFSGRVNCHRPIQMNDIPITFTGNGVLNADGSGSADLTETAFVLSTTIHFEGHLGRTTSAPGGTSQVRVSGRHGLLLVWSLPNNQLITRISVAGRSCSASFGARLKPGKSEYTLFDGSVYHYCDRPRLALTSCQVR